MIYLQQFDFKIEYRAGKKMLHVDYLFRSPIEQPIIYHLEEPTEKIFVDQIGIFKKIRYVMTFIYNAYGPWMLVRIDQKKEMYGLHHSPEGAVKTKDSNSLGCLKRIKGKNWP